MIELTLPYPPSVNSYWRTTASKPKQFGAGMKLSGAKRSPISVYISDKGQKFRTDVMQAVLIARAAKQLTGRLQLDVVLHPGDARVRDIDNSLKALLDSLSHAGVYIDDSQIDRLIVCRGDIIKGGQCRVLISEIAG
jgi:crossover junction endodeoxyribonuclease RusA